MAFRAETLQAKQDIIKFDRVFTDAEYARLARGFGPRRSRAEFHLVFHTIFGWARRVEAIASIHARMKSIPLS